MKSIPLCVKEQAVRSAPLIISSNVSEDSGAGAGETPSQGSGLHHLDAKNRRHCHWVNQELVKGQFLWRKDHAFFLNGEVDRK